jgi:predicted ABC-type transport system involved in lysophospholipase L1 biosynthesis ATPase subunit
LEQLGILQRNEAANQGRYSVEVKHVSKSYGETEIYSDLHFQLLKGTFVALVGPIGSGKTTMLNMFAGLERPTSGTILVMGQDITRMSDDSLGEFRAGTVGLVPQVQTLIPELTVRENVELPLHFARVDQESRQRKVDYVLEKVGIRGESKRMVSTLSVGEKQMVSFARALASDTPAGRAHRGSRPSHGGSDSWATARGQSDPGEDHLCDHARQTCHRACQEDAKGQEEDTVGPSENSLVAP